MNARLESPLLEAHPYRRSAGLELGPPVTLEQAKAAHIANVLHELDWHMSDAAKVLAVDRRTMYRLVQRYGLKRPQSAVVVSSPRPLEPGDHTCGGYGPEPCEACVREGFSRAT